MTKRPSGTGSDDPDNKDANRNSPNKRTKTTGPSTLLGTPKKSASDPKSHRVIRLENGLTACLISAPSNYKGPGWKFSSFYACKLQFQESSPVLIPSFSSDPDTDSTPSFTSECWKDTGRPLPKPKWPKRKPKSSYSSLMADRDFYAPPDYGGKDGDNPLSKAAICLAVGSGSLNDPQDNNGLSHFLEHMCFLGSKKYPEEHHCDKFYRYHGSSHNAYTQPDRTVYYCALDPVHMDTGMDIVSQKILNPLFKEETAQREVHAIDNEFLLKLPMVGMQVREILATTTKKYHPVGNFAWGNCKSLQLTDMHEYLSTFHSKHYTPDNMVLAVQSTSSLDDLQKLVEKYWGTASKSKEENRNQNQSHPGIHAKNPFDTPQFRNLYKVPAPYDALRIMWPVDPEAWKDFKMKPLEFLKFIFEDEKEGSLLSTYLQRNWACRVDASEYTDYSWYSNYSALFNVQILLLEDGIKNVDKIVQSLYDYIGILLHEEALPQKKILWQEMKQVRQEMFNSSGSGNALANVQEAAVNLLSFPNLIEDLYTKNLVTEEYDDAAFSKYVGDNLIPDSAIYIQYIHKAKLGSCHKKLVHCGTIYSAENIPKSFSEEIDFPDIKFSGKNNLYISTDFKIPTFVPPHVIVNSDHMYLKHNMVQGFDLPVAVWKIFIISSVKSSVLMNHCMDMWENYIRTILGPTIASASNAGINVGIKANNTFFEVKLSGSPQHMAGILGFICSQFFSVGELSEHHFNISKQMEQIVYRNYYNDNSWIDGAIMSRLYTRDQKTTIDTPCQITNINKSLLEKSVKEFREKLYVFGIFSGNTSLDQANGGARLLMQYQNQYEPIDGEWDRPGREIGLQSQDRCIRIFNTATKNESNNIICNVYQLALNSEDNIMRCKILADLMSPWFFYKLRTVNQMGYSTGSYGPSNGSQRAEIIFRVVSPSNKFSACDVSAQMDGFIKSFYEEFLEKMGEEEYSHIITSFQKGSYKQKIMPVSLTAMKTWYKNSILDCFPDNENRKGFFGISKISIQVLGNYNEDCKRNKHCQSCAWRKLENGNPSLEYAAPVAVCKGKSTERSGENFYIWNIQKFQDKVPSL